jgi:hypothetical protein
LGKHLVAAELSLSVCNLLPHPFRLLLLLLLLPITPSFFATLLMFFSHTPYFLLSAGDVLHDVSNTTIHLPQHNNYQRRPN